MSGAAVSPYATLYPAVGLVFCGRIVEDFKALLKWLHPDHVRADVGRREGERPAQLLVGRRTSKPFARQVAEHIGSRHSTV